MFADWAVAFVFGELPPQFCVLPSLLQDAFSAACLNGSLKPDSIAKSVLKQKFHATSEGVKEMSQRSPINLVKSYIHFIRGPRILERDLNSQLLRVCRMSYLGSPAAWLHLPAHSTLQTGWDQIRGLTSSTKTWPYNYSLSPPIYLLSSGRCWRFVRQKSISCWVLGFYASVQRYFSIFPIQYSLKDQKDKMTFGWLSFSNN